MGYVSNCLRHCLYSDVPVTDCGKGASELAVDARTVLACWVLTLESCATTGL